MFTVYLACLIFGSILLGASLFSSAEHGADTIDASVDMDTSVDVDTSVDSIDTSGDISQIDDIATVDNSIDHHIVHSVNHSIMKHSFTNEAARFFSFRNFIFFSTFFGLTGTVLTFLGMGFFTTLFSSVFLGSLSYVFGYGLMKYLKSSETGEDIKLRDLIGKTGTVTLGISINRIGKVIINIGSFSREYSAALSESCKEEKLKRNEKIIVIDINKDILVVDKLDF